MKNNRPAAKTVFLSITAVAAFLAVIVPGAAKEKSVVYTDDMIHEAFKSSPNIKSAHEVMIAQRERLHLLLDAFLLGDTEGVSKYAREISTAVGEIHLDDPLSSEKQAAVWEAMSQIIVEAAELQKEIDRVQYGNAYHHYARLSAQCIQCHQVARSWGVFPQPPESEADPEPEVEAEPNSEAKAPAKQAAPAAPPPAGPKKSAS